MMKKTLLLAFIVQLFAIGCDKGTPSGIPLVPVDIFIHVNDPQYINVSVPGGWVYIVGGSKGIILYRNSQEEFSAFDRHSTYEPQTNMCQVMVDSSNITAVDTCSGSEYLIIDGNVIKGPAALPLKKYQTTFDGQVLHIFN